MANQEKMQPGDTEVQFDRDVSEPGAQIKTISGVNADGTSWTLTVGDRVSYEDPTDLDGNDTGRISKFTSANEAIVYWDSGVETPIDVESLTSL